MCIKQTLSVGKWLCLFQPQSELRVGLNGESKGYWQEGHGVKGVGGTCQIGTLWMFLVPCSPSFLPPKNLAVFPIGTSFKPMLIVRAPPSLELGESLSSQYPETLDKSQTGLKKTRCDLTKPVVPARSLLTGLLPTPPLLGFAAHRDL